MKTCLEAAPSMHLGHPGGGLRGKTFSKHAKSMFGGGALEAKMADFGFS